MIQLQILSSPDVLLCENHLFHLNSLHLSNDPKKAHLLIKDEEINNSVLTLTVKESSLHVETIPKNKSYLSNGKKTIGAKLHQTGDEVTFGKTTIKILNIHHTHNIHEQPLPERYKNVIQNPTAAKVLETLEAELLHLEYLLNADNE